MLRLFILFFLMPCCVNATPFYTWQDCVRIAADYNESLLSASYSLQATQFQEGVARSGFFPKISADLDMTRHSRSRDFGSSSSSSSSQNQFTSSLVLTQNIFAGFADVGRTHLAKANTKASRANLEIAKAKVSYDLKSAFENLVYAKENILLTQSTLKRRIENLKLVQLRFDGGRENEGSLLLSKAYLEQAKYELLQANNQKRIAKAQLAEALGIHLIFDIKGRVPVHALPRRPDFLKIARNTPALLEVYAQELAAQSAVTIAKAGFFPSVDVGGIVSKQGDRLTSDQKTNWQMNLLLVLPILNGGADYYATKSAIESWLSSRSNRKQLEQGLMTQLESAFSNYMQAIVKMKVDASFQEAALLRAEIARVKYNNGLMSFEDWDRIENDLISRQNTYLASQRERVIAEAAWEQAQGKGALI